MRTLHAGAIVMALLAVANADDTFWQAIFTVCAGIGLFMAARIESADP